MNQRGFIELEVIKSVNSQEQQIDFPIRLLLPMGVPFALARQAIADMPSFLDDMEKIEKERIEQFKKPDAVEDKPIEPEII